MPNIWAIKKKKIPILKLYLFIKMEYVSEILPYVDTYLV